MRYDVWVRNYHRRAGNRHARAQQWTLAAKAYARHLKWWPKDVAVWVQLGHAEKELGRLDAAEAAYVRATAIARDDPEPYLHLAHLLRRQGRFEDALYAFRRLERLAPGAEVAETVRQLGKLQRHRTAIVPGRGAMLFVVQDYLAALRRDGPAAQAGRGEPAAILAALDTPALEAYFIVGEAAGPGDAGWLAVDPAALRAVVSLADGGEKRRDDLAEALSAAETRARPIVPGDGGFVVLLGAPWDQDAELGRLLDACEAGARLAAVIDAPAMRRLDGAAAASLGPRQAIVDLLYVADAIVTMSGGDRDRLLAMVDGRSGPAAPVAAVADRDAPPRPAGTGWPRTPSPPHDAAAGAALIATLRRLEGEHPTRRTVELVAFEEGVAFRPAAASTGTAIAADRPGRVLRWMFGRGFDEVDATAAWIGADTGHIRFATDLGAGEPFAVGIALIAGRGALGRRCSLAFADTPRHDRRWTVLTGDRLFLRLDGEGRHGGDCALELTVDASPPAGTPSPAGEASPADEPLPVEEPPRPERSGDAAVGVAAIGYHRLARPLTGRHLREQLLLG